MRKGGYTDEDGEYHEPMSKAERKAHAEDCGKFVAFMKKDQETSTFYQKEIAKLTKKFPHHEWQGSVHVPLSCKKCGMSAITPWGECPPEGLKGHWNRKKKS